ncbi:MAG TPA: sigma-70 family RNA polymerase sigma factor [Candidatus Paceibacterota bacterium]|nr:sigma-70 family RNA polymerase sigma factor [Candidatus Paceibacterota bacterium]
MDRLITLVNIYRSASELETRLKLVEEIIGEVRPALWASISRKCPEMADDICQETVVAIAKNLHRFYGETDQQFKSWCFGISRNKTNDCLRKLAKEKAEPLDVIDIDSLENVIEASANEEPMSAGEKMDLDYALNLLRNAKPPCLHYLWIHYVDGLSHNEMARILGQTYNAVRMQIKRCLKLAQSLVTKPA